MSKQAVLLFNMGGPNSLYEVEGFLKQLFNDPHILGIRNNFLRRNLANFIANKRLEEAKRNYQAIGGCSPIITHTLNLINMLNALDSTRFYTYCMRYTPPFAKDVLADLQNQNFSSLVLFSMYPQYSTTTTKSSLVSIQQALSELKFTPKIKVIERYFSHYGYNKLIISHIKKALDGADSKDFTLILSAHALPQSLVKKGDTYPQECEHNLAMLKEMLDTQQLHFKNILLTYQSKIGPIKWIGPTTQEVLKSLKNDKVLIFPLSFTIDNSETDYELAIECKHLAQQNGIKDFRVASCFNDSSEFAQFIVDMVEESTQNLA
ncbi:ferrochelatase [Helicobacter himalayensis]|uniref:ferrochelatase n=1 Tax=Helicobacter himalayensis TaxID=1591088 RepID=UPI003D6F8B8F